MSLRSQLFFLEGEVEELKEKLKKHENVLIRILDVILSLFGNRVYPQETPKRKSVREFLEKG